MTELFLQLPATTALYFLPVASKFDTISKDSLLHSLAFVETESVSKEGRPRSLALFHAIIAD